MPKSFLSFERDEIRSNLVERFEKIVSAYPENLAIKSVEGEISYKTLNHKANLLAAHLIEDEEGPEAPVAIYLSHTANPIIAMMGVLKAGKAFIPLNPSLPDEGNKKILSSSGAKVLITDHKYFEKLLNFGLGRNIRLINIDDLDSDLPKGNPGIRIKADGLVAIIYTSGSTGIPKGVMHVQQTIMHNAWVQTDSMEIKPDDRHILFSQLSYISGSTDILRTLLNGASLFPIDFLEVGLKGLSDVLENEKITIYHSVPTIFRRLLEEQGQGKVYPSIRIINLGGESVYSGDVDLMRKHFSSDCVLLNNLGSTEVPSFRRFLVINDLKLEKGNLPVGYPVQDKQVLILDENEQELEAGEVGEIVIESEFMSWGYFNDRKKTKESYRPAPRLGQSGRFFSGDLGSIDKDGRMKLLGRKDNQVKILGNRVELGEVEAHLLSIEGVHQAVALVINKDHDNLLVAYIVPSFGAELNVNDVRQKLIEKLPIYMLPKEFILMDSFPYTQTNKVDRKALPEPDLDKEKRQEDLLLPSNEIERKLVKIWQETLKISKIGINENIFDLGGDSLTAVTLFLAIEASFGVKMPISILLEAGDIKKQAAILMKKDFIVNWSPIIEVQPLGSKPPLFCLFGKGGNPLTFRQFSRYMGKDQPIYFLQARGLNGKETPLNVVENIASDFIQEIKKVYPQGPYRFCGASFGGYVAYEIAQQLKANNEIVDLVVLFDTYGPEYPKYKQRKNILKTKIDEVAYYLNKHISSIRDANPEERKNYIRYYIDFVPEFSRMIKRYVVEKLDQWKPARSLNPELVAVIRSNVEAAQKYHPSAYDGSVVLIRASKQPPGVIFDQKLGWGGIDIPELQIHEVEAHHGSVLFEPRVGEVVELLKQYLD